MTILECCVLKPSDEVPNGFSNIYKVLQLLIKEMKQAEERDF